LAAEPRKAALAGRNGRKVKARGGVAGLEEEEEEFRKVIGPCRPRFHNLPDKFSYTFASGFRTN